MDDNLASWLNEELKRRGWTFHELYRRSGVPYQSIAAYVGWGQIPTPKTCKKLAKALGVPYEEVLRLAGHLPPEEPPATDIAADELVALNLVRTARGKPPLATSAALGALDAIPQSAGELEALALKEFPGISPWLLESARRKLTPGQHKALLQNFVAAAAGNDEQNLALIVLLHQAHLALRERRSKLISAVLGKIPEDRRDELDEILALAIKKEREWQERQERQGTNHDAPHGEPGATNHRPRPNRTNRSGA